MTKRIWALILAMAAVFALSATAYASQEPDLEKAGSITFTLEWEGEPLDGGTMTVYPVGIFEKQGADYGFTLLPELAEHSLTLENGLGAETAGAIARVVDALSLEAHSAAIEQGKAFFGELRPGLFLVVQQEPIPGFAAMDPFLISLPVPQGEGYVYDLAAAPKVSLEPEPTEPPPPTQPPPDRPPDIPQTGQLNWPVPVLVVWGSVMVVFGLVLCLKRKERK